MGFLRAGRFRDRADVIPLPFAPLSRTISLTARREVLLDLPERVAGRLRPLLTDLIVGPALTRMPWLRRQLSRSLTPSPRPAAAISASAMTSQSASVRRAGSRTSQARISIARVFGRSGCGPRNCQFQKARALSVRHPEDLHRDAAGLGGLLEGQRLGIGEVAQVELDRIRRAHLGASFAGTSNQGEAFSAAAT